MILVVDDDRAITASLELLCKQHGHCTVSADGPDAALAALARHREVALVLLDLNFSRSTSGAEGLTLLGAVKAQRPELPVLLLTAWGSIPLAVAGMKAGASDFITKPWDNAQVVAAIATALGLASARTAAGQPVTRAELNASYDLGQLVGEDPAFVGVLSLAMQVANTDASILLTGQSGTGKEVIATAIHRNSPRRDRPFVKVNVGGISKELFESEMFGHVRGAFTDAHRDRKGRFELANGGTILLDEIGELEPDCQVKLLRVLADRTYEPLGSSAPQRLDLRILSATNRNLEAAVEAGRFREDLYYRLNLITIRLPSLNQRPQDIPLLAQWFLGTAAATYRRPPLELEPGALTLLLKRAWPGNVRQLEHLIQRAALVASGPTLDVDLLRKTLAMEGSLATETESLPAVGRMTLDEIEKAMILKGLAHHDGNLTRVAESLGMSRGALYRRLEKYGIQT